MRPCTSTSLKKALPLLGALLFLSFLLLLSCDDLESDDDDDNGSISSDPIPNEPVPDGPVPDPEFSVAVFAGDASAGFADEQGTTARFSGPQGLAVGSGGTVYVADYSNHRIRKITPAGLVSTLAGSGTAGAANGKGTAAQFQNPAGLAVASDGTLYVTDFGGHRIRKIDAAGTVTTVAGSGDSGFQNARGTAARFENPNGIAIDSSGNLYVVDAGNHRIRKIDATGAVTTFAGDGTTAQFFSPYGAALDAAGNLYVTDTHNYRIRKLTPLGVPSTLAGSGLAGFADGQGTAAQFNNPFGIAVAPTGTIYVADGSNGRIRKITPAAAVTTIVKDISSPIGIALSPDGSTAYVAAGNRIYKLSSISRAPALVPALAAP